MHECPPAINEHVFLEHSLCELLPQAKTSMISGGANLLTPAQGCDTQLTILHSNIVLLTSGLVSRSEDFHFMVWRWSLSRCSAETGSVGGRLLILGVLFLRENILCLSWFMLLTTFCSL